MRNFLGALIIILSLLSSCKFSGNKPNDILTKLKSDKIRLDSLLMNTTNYIQDQSAMSFKTVKDYHDSLILIQESPISESGDWSLKLTHYFTQKGETFAFQKELNFFNSVCVPGIAREKEIIFFDSNFKQIERYYRLSDERDNTLTNDSCLQYKPNYQIFKNRDQYLTNKKLTLR